MFRASIFLVAMGGLAACLPGLPIGGAASDMALHRNSDFGFTAMVPANLVQADDPQPGGVVFRSASGDATAVIWGASAPADGLPGLGQTDVARLVDGGAEITKEEIGEVVYEFAATRPSGQMLYQRTISAEACDGTPVVINYLFAVSEAASRRFPDPSTELFPSVTPGQCG